MPFLHNNVLDNGLDALDAANLTGEAIYICSQEPTTRTEAVTTYALGNGTYATTTGVEDNGSNGRKIVIDAISGGSITADGTATHWAAVDSTNLLAANALSSSKAVTNTNTFNLAAISIIMTDAVSA